MEEQLQDLTSKLASMETEKQSLAARNKILETALATAKGTPGRVLHSPKHVLVPNGIESLTM